jgi:hypothetical protein
MRRGRARVLGRFVTAWLSREGGSTQCEIRLPRLIGLGASASAAERGVVHLRTPLAVEPPSTIPQRGTSTDHVWVCGGGRRGGFDCGLAVTITTPAAEAAEERMEACPEADGDAKCQTDADGGDVPDWAIALLIALGAAGVGTVGIAATRRSTEGENVADTWDEIARKEYAKPDEPISARASDLSKIGAPVATSITAILAAIGGWVSEAPPEQTVIAVGVVVAVAVGGLLYVFAADFRSRAAVSVARFESLGRHAQAEAKGNEKVTADARAEVAKAEAASTAKNQAADAAKKEAEDAQTKAEKAREAADAKAAEASKRIEEADEKVVKLAAELTDIREQLRRFTGETKPATPGPPAPPS